MEKLISWTFTFTLINTLSYQLQGIWLFLWSFDVSFSYKYSENTHYNLKSFRLHSIEFAFLWYPRFFFLLLVLVFFFFLFCFKLLGILSEKQLERTNELLQFREYGKSGTVTLGEVQSSHINLSGLIMVTSVSVLIAFFTAMERANYCAFLGQLNTHHGRRYSFEIMCYMESLYELVCRNWVLFWLIG